MQDAKAMSDDAKKAAASAEEAYAKAAEAVGKKSAQEIVPETKKSSVKIGLAKYARVGKLY